MSQAVAAPEALTQAPPRVETSRGKLWGVAHDSVILAKRGILHIPREPGGLVGAIAFPLMFVLLFRYVFGDTISFSMPKGVSGVNYLMAGIIVQGLIFGSVYTSLGLASDAKEGLIDRFRSLPMTRSSVVLGRILADMTINLIGTIITIGVAILVGFRPTTNVLDWIYAMAMMGFLVFTACWIGAFIGMSLGSVEAVNSIGQVWIFPVTFVSSAFVRPENMPTVLRVFAENQPFTLVVNSVRGWLTGYPTVGNDWWIASLWLIGILIIFIPLAVRAYNRRASA